MPIVREKDGTRRFAARSARPLSEDQKYLAGLKDADVLVCLEDEEKQSLTYRSVPRSIAADLLKSGKADLVRPDDKEHAKAAVLAAGKANQVNGKLVDKDGREMKLEDLLPKK